MQDTKERVALGSIVASGGLTIAKGVVGYATGSLAILSEAAHSLIDLAATIITYGAVRVSNKPADDEHHYGHGKVESVAALAETVLLFILSAVVIWEAVKRLAGEQHIIEASAAAFAVILLSIVVDFFRARLLYRVARETGSEALEADALHFGSDMWSSLAVLIGLFGILLGYQWADAAAALVVALFVCLAGWRLGRRTIDTLVDTAPPGIAERLTQVVQRVPGVVAVEGIRARQVGNKTFADITIGVSRTLPMDRLAAVKDAATGALATAFPQVEANISTNPRALDNETVLERVAVIARNRALAVHHITAHSIEGRLSISLDLEVDGTLRLDAAHEIASGLEKALADEFGAPVEVETHIEPLHPDPIAGQDAAPARQQEIAAALAVLAVPSSLLRDVHNVRVRVTDDGEIVNFHCRVAPDATVHVVHEAVDELERGLRRRFPTLKRVIGHAEPMPGKAS